VTPTRKNASVSQILTLAAGLVVVPAEFDVLPPPFQAPEVFEGQRLTIESARQRRGTGPDVAWEGRLNPALLILGRPQNRGTAERGKCVRGRKQQRQTQLPVICSELQRSTWV
jgi:hypothetical protein